MRLELSFKGFILSVLFFLLFASIFIIFTFYQVNINLVARISKLERSYQYILEPEITPVEKLSILDNLAEETLLLGQKELSRHKAIICAITRDNADDLGIMIKHIELIGKAFADYRVVIFENDSVDGTKFILRRWHANNLKVSIESEDFRNKKRPSIKFLADARNHYLDLINSRQEYDDFDIVIVVDMDMSYGIDIRGLEHSFSKVNEWDAVCSNGIFNSKGQMFDMFAFRNKEFPYTPADNSEKYWKEIVPKGQKVYDINLGLIPVESCFGGLAIYKRQFIKGCRYDSINRDCEHINFHQCLRDQNGGRMFMNPAQVIRYSHYKDE
ncbi:MAG: hypothetical protein K0Q51_952 [Rickettsiaceae bacterium]|jgi:hypothetical protein|nr:hypothetical protein [Rickettsiaceae bacterium]